MAPSKNVEKIIGGILARYQEMFRIEIYAYCFLSNHYHLLIKASESNTDEFLENVNREIALRINRKLGREGTFWYRRYDDIEVVSGEENLLRAFLYVSTNATKHGLLEDSSHWPGLNSFNHSLKERPREFSFYHYSAGEDEEKNTRHTLTLTSLPDLKKLSKEEKIRKTSRLLQERMERYRLERKEEKKGFLGIDAILNQNPCDTPFNISRSKRPVCYTNCSTTLVQKRKEARARRAAYNDASFEYRLGNLNFEFPKYSFKPPLHRAPRFERFKPLTAADFLQ